MRERVRQMLRRAGVEASWSAAPSAGDVLRAADERLATELGAETTTIDPRLLALADKLIEGREARELVARLLARAEHTGATAPADVTPILPPTPRAAQTMPPPAHGQRPHPRHDGGAPGQGPAGPSPGFVPFRINWGERQGADPRRLLALVCRRGGIRGSDVGAIRIGFAQSTFEVSAPLAQAFSRAAREPDARDPKIHITPVVPTADAPSGGPPQVRRDRVVHMVPQGPPRGAPHGGGKKAPGGAKGYGPPKRKVRADG
jgi:ATP-dependent RNA helicase DeaD